MSEGSSFYGPFYYSIVWTVVGVAFILLAISAFVLIFFITRKKKIRSLSTLKIEAPKTVDLNELKTKYLGLIDQAERNYENHMIKASVAHQHFSLIVRLFYAEGLGFHADIMTLTDLKNSFKQDLVDLIEHYYPDEFNTLEKGSVKEAAEMARELVRKQ